MSTALTVYVLMFPVIVLGIMITIARGFAKDYKEAREQGRTMV